MSRTPDAGPDAGPDLVRPAARTADAARRWRAALADPAVPTVPAQDGGGSVALVAHDASTGWRPSGLSRPTAWPPHPVEVELVLEAATS